MLGQEIYTIRKIGHTELSSITVVSCLASSSLEGDSTFSSSAAILRTDADAATDADLQQQTLCKGLL